VPIYFCQTIKKVWKSFAKHFCWRKVAFEMLVKLIPVDNFTDILREAFLPIIFRQKFQNQYLRWEKPAQITFKQKSCSKNIVVNCHLDISAFLDRRYASSYFSFEVHLLVCREPPIREFQYSGRRYDKAWPCYLQKQQTIFTTVHCTYCILLK